MKKLSIILLLISVYVSVYSQAGDNSTANEEQNISEKDPQMSIETVYPVKATINEVKNRTVEATVRNHRIIIDQPKEFGADDKGVTPPELLAISLGSCVISTIQLIAVQDKLDIKDISVTVEGTIDFAKALGVSDAKRAGFSDFTVKVSFKSSMPLTDKKKLIDKVSKIGAAIDNIQNTTPVEYELIEP